MNKKYHISRWCHVYRQDEMIALLHSLSLAIIYLPQEIGEQVIQGLLPSEIDEDVQSILLDSRFLVIDDDDEMQELYELRERLKQEIYLDMMYLLVTDGCNLRCRYCFEDSPKASKLFRPTLMNNNIAGKAIELFAKLTTQYGRKNTKKIVHLYGGEPLMNPKVVHNAILKVADLKKSKDMPQECEVVIVSNGTLLTEEMAQFFADNKVTIGISLDAPARLNNIHRLAKDNKVNVFQQTRRAYEIAKEKGANVGLSATLTPEVVANFDEALDFFLNDIGIEDGISFNILHYNPALQVDAQYFEAAAKCMIKAFKEFRKLGIYEERMMRKVKAFVEQDTMFADCGVVGNQIVVAPDGKIGVCQDFVKPRSYFDGSVFDRDFDPIKQGLFANWQNRSPLFMKQCFDCEAIGICGGGCPASVEVKTGNRWNIDERICPHSKLTLQWLVWDTYHNSIAA